MSVIVDVTEKKKEELVREALIDKLQKALAEIKTLQGIIPICCYCKKIRDDEGFYREVEAFISRHTDARFSHGLCPEWKAKYFPDSSSA